MKIRGPRKVTVLSAWLIFMKTLWQEKKMVHFILFVFFNAIQ